MSHLRYFGRAVWSGAWRPLVVSGESLACILLQVCFVILWTYLSCQAPHLAARSSKCDYELCEEVLLFVCSKHCPIDSFLAAFSLTLRCGDWLLPGPLHVVLCLAGLSLLPLSFIYLFFSSWKVPIHAFLCKWACIPRAAFPILMQLSWDRQWVL